MTGRRGRPKTTGKSHNKRANTYTSTRNMDASIPVSKKSKPAMSLTNFFKPVNKTVNSPENFPVNSPENETVDNPENETVDIPENETVNKLVDNPENESANNMTIEPTTSNLNEQVIAENSSVNNSDNEISESEHTDSSDSEEEEPTVQKFIKHDGRKNALSFTEKWEKKYTWSYYSTTKGGWFCKTCEEYSDSHDAYWKTLPRKHDEHPGVFFKEHVSSEKHAKAIRNKQNIKVMLSKGNVVRQLTKGMENKTERDRKRNRNMIKNFLKTVYFLAKKKWAVKNNFEDMIKFLSDIGIEEIKLHLENAPQNATYTSTTSAEQFLKIIGDYLNEQLVTDILAAGDFSVLADESTDEGDRAQMSVFVRFVNITTNKPEERFLGMVKLTTSKKAADLHDVIMELIKSKGLDPSKIRFSGLDGTNAMSGERKGLQRLIRHTAPHSQYLNCKNHRLALCLVHLIPLYQKLIELDGLLISLWKTFKYSTIKQAIFEEAQTLQDMKPLKILKACVTRWLTHGESCMRIISRFGPLLDALDCIFTQRGDAEAKGVRDQLLEPEIICMLLLLAEVLAPINNFSRYLQTSTLLYCDVTAKLDRLLQRLHTIKDSLANHNSIDSDLKFFNKAVQFLTISSQRNELGRNTRGRTLAAEFEPEEHIHKFLPTAYAFMDDLIEEITEEITDNNVVLPAFNVFNPNDINKTSIHRQEQMTILANHYGSDLTDTYENHSNQAEALISIQQQQLEQENFFQDFDDAASSLTMVVKNHARRLFNRGEIKQEEMQEYIISNAPTSSDIYAELVKSGANIRFPSVMRLFKLSLLIPPSTSGVERGFSVMNLLVSPLRTTLNENNVDRLMRICLDGPDQFDDDQLEHLVDNFKNSAPRRIAL